ncbi:putative lipoprotein [Leadbettera azotonutricia ZAS-9]|uniref:Putative lipoprotein n=2 Tax=Leadbettera azotonutricia TaxID=150829 RepID=F5YF19_LEAAZ|nr:putative lipoprotein [Leadbettera azotonutricia ZAS-9]
MMSKRLQQVDDIVSMHGNLLLWSCLGSGAIGVPYLYKEAFEKIQPRFKFYGYLNDSEFCRECEKRDIAAYAVLWKAQLWEFPIELNKEEDTILGLNKLVGQGTKTYLGMSELSTNRYPKLFDPIEKFFPDGITNSNGEKVKDFLEEFSARTLDNKQILSSWLMVPGHDHRCYSPCANNPSYMTYMKKLLEIMIDAGAGGILLDEYDVQLHVMNNSGCFCKDCIKGFRQYLKDHPCEEAAGLNLDTFDYRAYLKEKGYTDDDLKAQQLDARIEIPLYKQFIKFNLFRMEDDMRQIYDHVKVYSKKTRGKELPVSANLYNCLPHAHGLRKYCDTINGEKGGIKTRQDAFYKFGYSFMDDKKGSFIEDPNEIIFQLIDDIDHNKNDAYCLFMLEPLVHGFNISISYGGWLMNFKKDSFYPNLETERKMGAWLDSHDSLFKMDPAADLAVVYDQRSALDVEFFTGNYGDPNKEGGFRTFFDVTGGLCEKNVLYNVLYINDEQPLTAEQLKKYKKLLLPDVYLLSKEEKKVVDAFAKTHEVRALGRIDRDFFPYRFQYTKFAEVTDWALKGTSFFTAESDIRVGTALHHAGNGYNLHLINYNLNSISREIEPVKNYKVKFDKPIKNVTVNSFPHGGVTAKAEGCDLEVHNLDIETVITIGF